MAQVLCSRAIILRNIWCPKQPIATTVIRYTADLVEKPQGPNVPSTRPPQSGPEPVQQKLIARIPVEYHGVSPVNFTDDSTWQRVYKFPYLSSSRSVIRAKVYLTGLSVGMIIHRIYSFLSLGYYDSWTVTCVSVFSLGSIGALIFTGNFFKKIICQVYVSEDQSHVRLSRFTFFGRRRDLVLPLKCIIPLTETNGSSKPLFLSLHMAYPDEVDDSYDFYEFYEDKFLVCIKFGGVTDVEKFESVFGRVLTKKFF